VFGKKFYMRFSFGVSKSNLNKIIDVIDMIK
jgi:hypothetical protein